MYGNALDLGTLTKMQIVGHMHLDQHIFTLTDGALGQIARCEQLRKFCGIGPRYFDLPLYRNVTQNGVVDQIPEVFLWVAE